MKVRRITGLVIFVQPENSSKPMDDAESTLMSLFFFFHFPTFLDSVIPCFPSPMFFNLFLHSIDYTAFWITITFIVWVFYSIFILI